MKAKQPSKLPAIPPLAQAAGSVYYPLFKHMCDNHGLTLLESELEDIRIVARQMERLRDGEHVGTPINPGLLADVACRAARPEPGDKFIKHDGTVTVVSVVNGIVQYDAQLVGRSCTRCAIGINEYAQLASNTLKNGGEFEAA